MKIIIDARMISGKIHGIARYLYEILKIFKEEKVETEFVLITNKKAVLEKLELIPYFQFEEVRSRPFSRSEFFEIPKVINKIQADLYHAPSISVPLLEVIPTVITIHDLIPYHTGGFLHKTYCNTVLRRAIRYAKAIIAVSHYTRSDIINVFTCSPDKIFVTYESASKMSLNSLTWDDMKKKYKIKPPFIFSLGNPKPHKNMTGLVDIYSLVREKYKNSLSLVMGSRASKELTDKIEKSPYKDDIIRIDYLSDFELEVLYSNAEVFVYPSYFEGFGLPPLEAMIRGCPVVSSGRTSLPEVVGKGGIIVDPDNVKSFANHIHELLTNRNLRDEWSGRAKKWVERFSWKKCAFETMEIYEKAARTI